MRHHYVPIRMAKKKKMTTSNADEDVEQQKPLFIASGDAKWYSHFGGQFGSFLPS